MEQHRLQKKTQAYTELIFPNDYYNAVRKQLYIY